MSPAVLIAVLASAAMLIVLLLIAVVRQMVTLGKRNAVIAAQVSEIDAQKGLIAKLTEDRDRHKTRADAHHRNGSTIGRALREKTDECDGLKARLEAAGAVLDVAYVRGERGHFRRFRAQEVAA